MKSTERNYVTEAEDLICELERMDRFIELLFEEFDDAHSVITKNDAKLSAYWLKTRNDTMDALLQSIHRDASSVRAELQKWVDEYFEKGD